MNIGYVGLGSMGGALARRLQCTHPLQVYDLHAGSVERLAAQGATPCAGLDELAARCDTVLLCLPTSDHVRTAIFGPDADVDQSAAKPTNRGERRQR